MDNDFDIAITEVVENQYATAFHDPDLESCITQNVLCLAVYAIHNGKVPGRNGIMIEMINLSLHILEPYILSLYDMILESGHFTEYWWLAVICSLYKSGDRSDVNNYRYISLLDIMGKIFVKILNNRLTDFIEIQDKLYEEHAGYKKGYSVINNIFIIQGTVQKIYTEKR